MSQRIYFSGGSASGKSTLARLFFPNSLGFVMLESATALALRNPSFAYTPKDIATNKHVIAFCIRFDRRYAHDVWRAAGAFRRYRKLHGKGNPDGPRHRIDNPAIVELIENRTTEKEEHGYGQSDGYGSCGYPKPKQ